LPGHTREHSTSPASIRQIGSYCHRRFVGLCSLLARISRRCSLPFATDRAVQYSLHRQHIVRLPAQAVKSAVGASARVLRRRRSAAGTQHDPSSTLREGGVRSVRGGCALLGHPPTPRRGRGPSTLGTRVDYRVFSRAVKSPPGTGEPLPKAPAVSPIGVRSASGGLREGFPGSVGRFDSAGQSPIINPRA
jgi:hypothetical protein